MDKITATLCEVMNSGRQAKIIFGGKRKKSLEYNKVIMHPVTIKGELMYQAEFHYEKKVIHKNISYYMAVDFAEDLIINDFKQINILTEDEDIQILAAKPEKPKIMRNKASRAMELQDHNRKKNYIIEDHTPCDFLIALGVMSPEGHVYKNHYSKFRQINRFLEIADDSFQYLPDKETLRIIDFGCGKSYLTFALYYYLKLINNRDVEIIGLDLKEDVIAFCNKKAEELNYHGLEFITGDIADFESTGADMVVTLHACDTATDYALINAVKWKSKVILSVPCCQHELFSQINNDINQPMLKHGIIKDKFTELLTDGLRGMKLEEAGYNVSMLEFTSLEHTSKNIMIKALLPEAPKPQTMKKASKEYEALKSFYKVNPTIDLLKPAY